MKVGIVTVYDSANVGSYLQAYALQQIIKSHGDTPVFIRTRSRLKTFGVFMGYSKDFELASFGERFDFYFDYLLHLKTTIKRIKKYYIYKKAWRHFDSIVSVKKANKMSLDMILYGSDEIWNMKRAAFRNPYFYGINLESKYKIAFAVSVGDVDKELFVSKDYLLNGIRKFDNILYRDYRTRELLECVNITTQKKVSDPTLMIDIMSQFDNYECGIDYDNYFAVYCYSVSDEIRDWISRFAKEKGIGTVAVSIQHNWCDGYINCSPLELASVLKKAAYVYTATFHGTIFSALCGTKFIVNCKVNKVREILEELELEQRALDTEAGYEVFKTTIEAEYDMQKLENILSRNREMGDKIYRQYVSLEGNL